MQLSRLLARLTPDERAIVLERRLGPNAVGIDDRALAAQLAQPSSLTAVLWQLNNGQLVLLRWLATRRGLEATWTEFVEALGDRLAPGLRDAYLRDLRLWALVDYDPQPGGGFVGTYPAVVSVLPSQRNVKLRDHLTRLNSDVLLRMTGALGLRNPPTRKEPRIELLMDTLTQPESCRAAVGRLSDDARDLFEWVRSQDGWVGAQEMAHQAPAPVAYGSASPYRGGDSIWYSRSKSEPVHPLTQLLRCGLVLPLSPYAGWYAPSAFTIAEEVELAYSGRTLFDTSPLQPPPLQPAEGVDGRVPTPANLLRDVAHLLGFLGAERIEWRQDGQPYKRSLVAFGKLIGSPDPGYPEVLWELVGSAELIRRARRGQPGFVPVTLGKVSPIQLFNRLLLAWVYGGSPTSGVGIGRNVAQEARARLLQLLQSMPTDTWVLKSSVEAWLRFHWPMVFTPGFQRYQTATPDPSWSSLRYLILGHGATSDGQDAVMLPAGHQRLLSEEASREDGLLPPWDESWIVQPDRSIVAPPNAHPDAQFDLWQVAQLESNQGASVFRATPASIAAALNRGLTPNEVRKRLETRSRVPLPPTVERLIDDQGQRYGRIKVGTAQTYVQTDDPALLEELRRHAKLKNLDWRDVAPGTAFVVSSDPNAVLETLRRAGYLPVMDQDQPGKPSRRPNIREIGQARARTETTSIWRAVEEAIGAERVIRATWVEQDERYTADLEPLDFHGDALHAFDLSGDGEVILPIDTIVELKLGGPIEDTYDTVEVLYTDDDDDDDDDEVP